MRNFGFISKKKVAREIGEAEEREGLLPAKSSRKVRNNGLR